MMKKYVMTMGRRSFSTQVPEIKRVGMVGLGLMGHGIAQTAATAGYEVVALDMNDSALSSGLKRIEGSLDKLHARRVKKGEMTEDQAKDKHAEIMGRIQGTTDKKDLADCDLVIEVSIESSYAVCTLVY